MYVTVRRYANAKALADAMAASSGEVQKMIRGVHGFVYGRKPEKLFSQEFRVYSRSVIE